ncbi:putative conserved membrane protein [Synechococcus sp. SYN20]|uniref:hypothetical protein n=1 Tax=Synechococcus sp. SYN20 TaxID=1050714 RepID=UPI0016476BD9|nr:hypothetical protein [Synechococcus sp. SYN20]QNJ27539.1 putative conserved membrane protein [Synechococcus sp. SYN20]
MPAETNAPKPKPKRPARPRFWAGPLVAGACFALGYGITQRVVLIRSGLEQAEPQSFKARAFPGESLEALRLRHGETGTLEADVAAKELIDAKASNQANALKKAKLAKELEQRKAKEEAERIAAAAMEPDRSQQAVLNTPSPLEDTPTLNETTLLEADAPTELLDSELPLDAPNAWPTESLELAQPTPAVELEAPVVIDSFVIEDAPAASDLFFTPIEAPTDP